MKRNRTIGTLLLMLPLSLALSSCANGISGRGSCAAQLVNYETVTTCEAELHATGKEPFDSDEVIATLQCDTPVKIVGLERIPEEDWKTRDSSLLKVTVKATIGDAQCTGWLYVSDMRFDSSLLEKTLKECMKGEPYAYYVASNADGIDQALGLKLMMRACEGTRAESDPERRRYLFALADVYMCGIAAFDPASCDMTPLHLAARYDDIEFLKDAYYWCVDRQVSIDSPSAGGDTALIVAVINGNAEGADFLLGQGADMRRKNAKGKTAEDCMLDSRNAAIKNLAVYSRDAGDYGEALDSLAADDMRDPPDDTCLDVPASVYMRYRDSGMTLSTVDYDEFMTELSVRESSGAEGRSRFATEPFPFDARIHTDDGAPLNLRDGPGLGGKVIGSATDGSPVTILSRAETTDDIDGITDYWYRIRCESAEGWCFGGYLSRKIPIGDDSSLRALGYGEQLPFNEGDTAYALKDCSLRARGGDSVSVKAYEELEILAAFDDGRTSFGDSAICGYYLAKNADNACGVIGGANLANDRFTAGDGGEFEFYVFSKRSDDDGVCSKLMLRELEGEACDDVVLVEDGVFDGAYEVRNSSDVRYFLFGTVDYVSVGRYSLDGRDLAFVEVTCVNYRDENEADKTLTFFTMEDCAAHFALSDHYVDCPAYGDDGGFSGGSSSWDPSDPSEVTIEHYGRYFDEDDSPADYTSTYTWSRNPDDPFSYELTNEEHSDELPGY